jgi:ribonuclease BN (tRNA processing enzyme)
MFSNVQPLAKSLADARCESRRIRNMIRSIVAALALACSTSAFAANKQCTAPFAVQILGSGGPIAEGSRAGSSAIVWIGGKAAVLVDAGSGAFVRYGEAGINFADHRAVLITHFHADHVSDLDAILNSGGFSDRSKPLTLIGPAGSEDFPGMTDHLRALFDAKSGAFRYLSGYLDGNFGRPKLLPVDINTKGKPTPYVDPIIDLKITPIPVEHGVVPALAYLIETGGKVIVFSGDQNDMSDNFEAALKGRKPDLLVAHNVIPEGEGQPIGLHRAPHSIGTLAAAIEPKLLVLSHNMKRALVRQEEGEAAIRESYKGPMVVANDLDCFAL